jgi:septum formation protein
MPEPLILASRSAIRRTLLEGAGLDVEVEPSTIDERRAEADFGGGEPAEVARRLSEAKALDIARTRPGRLVVAADQTLALGPERFSKARSVGEARERLRRLRGRTHELHSGYALARGGDVLRSGVSSARLTMRDFSDAFLDAYLARAGDGILGSVGCYQLEGLGVTLFESVEGDYFTILGLPLLALLAALRAEGAVEG